MFPLLPSRSPSRTTENDSRLKEVLSIPSRSLRDQPGPPALPRLPAVVSLTKAGQTFFHA